MKNSFREALGRHLLAIEERDLDALADTVADEEILLVMSDGRLARSMLTLVFQQRNGKWAMVLDQNTPVR